MKEISQSIIKSTKSLLGRLTTVTTIGCILALVFLVAASPQPQKSGKALPFKASGIVTENTGNSMEVVGTATHLGRFDSQAHWEFNSSTFTLHVWASFTAANGDTLQAEFPAWVVNPDGTIATSGVAIITGGTGRFAGASGSYGGGFSGPNQEIFTVEGTISY